MALNDCAMLMVFFGFLAGAALGGLAGYTLGAWTGPGRYWYPYYAPYYYQPYYYPAPAYAPYYYQPYPVYGRSYWWHPSYGYW